jgi:hypothetical protein
MPTDDEFTRRLMGFRLSEKEAQIYLHLLKYGPKTPSPIAKTLKTYREDVHRTLNSLIEKGMVRPSLNSPTVYAAVDLDASLASALKKHESELREMETRKRELQELANQQRFRPADKVSTFKIIKNVKEGVTAITSILPSVEKEFLWISAEPGIAMSSLFGVFDAEADFIRHGGQCRGITNLQYSGIKLVQQLLDMGMDVRHYTGYRGLSFAVFDRKLSISAINVNVTRIALDEPMSMLLVDDPVYADYLASIFELLWKQSVPVEERIQELLKQGPPEA